MEQISIILIVNLFILITKTSSQSSPCPNVFQYQSDGQQTYGIITIPPPGEGRTVMEASLGIQGVIHDESTGGLRLLKSLVDSVDDARKGRDVQYILNFPTTDQLPLIVKLTLNYEDICRGPQDLPPWTYGHEFMSQVGLTELSVIPNFPSSFDPTTTRLPSTTTRRPATTTRRPPTTTRRPPTTTRRPPTTTRRPPTTTRVPPIPKSQRGTSQSQPRGGSWVNSLPFAQMCGTQSNDLTATSLIIGGEDVDEGEFPWLVALYHFTGAFPEYKCGASLISDTYVITAAHCVTKQALVYMEFGRHNISNRYEDGSIVRVSPNIYQHPDYVSGPHGDVALILIEKILFTARIKPICLWSLGTNLDNILRTGTVTGWGQIENGDDSGASTPMKLDVRTVDMNTCRNSHEKLKEIATDKTFCAGGQRKGPCHGDSGSGFYIQHKSVWYLRGIISTSLGTAYVCHLDKYAVYADLAYYMDFMRKHLT